ncbi:MAG: hypothetical protein ACE5Z5_09920 [Candidatus Bathyarchaeia archaeon]
MVLVIDDAILVYLAWKIFGDGLGGRFIDNVNRQYLTVLEDDLKRVTLLYSRKEISELEYKRVSAELKEAIKSFRLQLKPPEEWIEVRF